jgi:hypothetical protein
MNLNGTLNKVTILIESLDGSASREIVVPRAKNIALSTSYEDYDDEPIWRLHKGAIPPSPKEVILRLDIKAIPDYSQEANQGIFFTVKREDSE